MIRKSFNENWTVEEAQLMEMMPGEGFHPVTLPHDATIEHARKKCGEACTKENQKQQALSGGWPSGFYKYRKEFWVPATWKNKAIYLEFEGAYRDASVLVDDDFAVHHANGYTPFLVDLKPFLRYDGMNHVSVTVKNDADARWYAGAGLYRPVHLFEGGLLHITPNGLKVHTERVEQDLATICCAFTVRNMDYNRTACTAVLGIKDASGTLVASDRMAITVFPGETSVFHSRLYVSTPSLWEEDHPALYTISIVLQKNGEELDLAEEVFGIRTLSVDPRNGLLVNKKPVLLRGGCIHEDKGTFGMATFDEAEERRVKKLKAAGFNALRMAHHPASRALMRACDKYGIYLMTEFSDVWGRGKTRDDYADSFAAYWEKDVAAMVCDAYNHPSVIMYSIGNEIPDIDYGFGGRISRLLADRIKALDPYRLTLNSVNGVVGLGAMGEQSRPMQSPQQSGGEGDINVAMTDLVLMMEQLMQSPMVGDATQESFAAVDVAGYNYMEARYEMDGQLYPNRVIVGSETYPPIIAKNWTKVKALPHLIGDFTWAAWDYLGESGIAHTTYGKEPVYKPYPYRSAYAGDFDIIGNRRPISYYRQVVFGKATGPYLFAQNPKIHGLTPNKTPWCWHDVEALWSYPGEEGKETTVEIYAQAAGVELFLNGKKIANGACTEENEFIFTCDVAYEPGELSAIAYDENHVEIGSCALRTPDGDMRIKAIPEVHKAQVGFDHFIYFEISREDCSGSFVGTESRIQVQLDGPGELIGLASVAPTSRDEFFENEADTWMGRLLAVVRPVDAGQIYLRLHTEGKEYISEAVEAYDEKNGTKTK